MLSTVEGYAPARRAAKQRTTRAAVRVPRASRVPICCSDGVVRSMSEA